MQVILKPLSPPELEEIVINDGMFSVGRCEPPFVNYKKSAVACLSDRHARIFQVKGAVFIADAGSKRGTKVNGKKLQGLPIRLTRSDEICFGGKLNYRVSISDQSAQTTTRSTPPARINLILLPTHDELETVVINRFPFLISKSNKPLAQYAEKFPKDINYVSRRHGYFSIKGFDLYVEDLGSSNGTYVNGTRLDKQAKLLKDGDLIEIGSIRFAYTVRIEYEDQPLSADANVITSNVTDESPQNLLEQDKTIFVSAANAFLDIFCAQQDEVDTSVKQNDSPEIDKPVKIKPAKTSLGRSVRRGSVFLKQLKGAFSEDQHNSRNFWLIAGILCIAGTITFGVYSLGETKREIESLMSQEKYQQTLELANEYLNAHPDDNEVLEIAAEALLKSSVPQWVTALEQHDYESANKIISQAKQNSFLSKGGAESVELLVWVANLERFVHGRGGIDAPIVIFSQEREITKLLDWWEQDEKVYRRTLTSIANYTPDFKEIYSRVFSNLRALRSEKSVHLTAIDRLKSTINEKLDSGNLEQLGPILDKFESKYPRVEGMDKVRQDWASYLTLKRNLDDKNLRGVIELLSRYNFEIPPFKEKLEVMMANNLPTYEFVEQYLRASVAWRAGKPGDTLTLLRQPVDPGWQNLVTAELSRKQLIVKKFELLNKTRRTPDYDSSLIAFYKLLDKNEDNYFLEAIESDFNHYRKQITGQANRALELAKKDWEAYRQNGGIRGLQRLEAGISRFFKTQSKRLSDAYSQATRGIQLYQSADVSYPPAWQALYDEVKAETELQRRSLNELAMVLKPSLLNDKLKLMPEL